SEEVGNELRQGHFLGHRSPRAPGDHESRKRQHLLQHRTPSLPPANPRSPATALTSQPQTYSMPSMIQEPALLRKLNLCVMVLDGAFEPSLATISSRRWQLMVAVSPVIWESPVGW